MPLTLYGFIGCIWEYICIASADKYAITIIGNRNWEFEEELRHIMVWGKKSCYKLRRMQKSKYVLKAKEWSFAILFY